MERLMRSRYSRLTVPNFGLVVELANLYSGRGEKERGSLIASEALKQLDRLRGQIPEDKIPTWEKARDSLRSVAGQQ